jgi:hypothetical protein
MSKKNKGFISQSSSGAGMSHETEYRIIKFDLVRVVALNFVYLVVILGLYYANVSSGFLDKFFAKILHF